MRVIDDNFEEISYWNMKDGQIGVISRWSTGDYIGVVVQRYGKHLVALNKPYKSGWQNLWPDQIDGCMVRILPPGTKLEV
jgi:hypothetical protein